MSDILPPEHERILPKVELDLLHLPNAVISFPAHTGGSPRMLERVMCAALCGIAASLKEEIATHSEGQISITDQVTIDSKRIRIALAGSVREGNFHKAQFEIRWSESTPALLQIFEYRMPLSSEENHGLRFYPNGVVAYNEVSAKLVEYFNQANS